MVGAEWARLRGAAERQRLERTPNVMTEWGHWLTLHPESTAYDLFDGRKYEVTELPREMSRGSEGIDGQSGRACWSRCVGHGR